MCLNARSIVNKKKTVRGVILYIKESIQACEIKLGREADCDEAVWCNIFFRKFKINYWITLLKSKHKRGG